MSQKNRMYAILDAPDRQVTKTFGGNGVLSRLWRQMLLDLKIGPVKFGEILQEHVTNPINGVHANRKDQISYRGNLTKEFAKPQMTWKVFMKALRFLNIINIKLVIVAQHANTKYTVHETMVSFGSRHNPSEFNKLLNQPESAESIQSIPYLDDVSDESILQSVVDEAEIK